MSSCEKCWNESYRKMMDGLYSSQMEAYRALLKENDGKCTPKEQAGQWWDEELQMDRRNIKETK